jgi:hypothetical protein
VAGFPARQALNRFEETADPSKSTEDEDEGEDEDEDGNEDEVENEDNDEDEADSVADGHFCSDAIDDRALQNSLNTLKVKLQGLSREINSYQLARDPETMLNQIHEETKKLSEFKDQETRIVGFIGETGAGLCFLISTQMHTGLKITRQELRHQLNTGPERPCSLGMYSTLCIVMRTAF